MKTEITTAAAYLAALGVTIDTSEPEIGWDLLREILVLPRSGLRTTATIGWAATLAEAVRPGDLVSVPEDIAAAWGDRVGRHVAAQMQLRGCGFEDPYIPTEGRVSTLIVLTREQAEALDRVTVAHVA